MVVKVVLSGGLGNQLFQYAAGRALAIRTRTSLQLDLRFYVRANSQSKRPWILQFPLIADCKIYSSRFRAHGLPLRLWRKLAEAPQEFTTSHGFDSRFLSLRGNTILKGLFQSHYYFESQFPQFAGEIDPIAIPDFAEKSLVLELGLGSKVGVHVRRGDYLSHASFAMVDYCQYYKKVADEVQASGDQLVVFSDDIDWCRRQSFFAGSIFYRSGECIPPYYDLGAMSCCKRLYIANSTFSWWAGWFGAKRGAEVIVPAKWILDFGTAQLDLVPEHWRILSQ